MIRGVRGVSVGFPHTKESEDGILTTQISTYKDEIYGGEVLFEGSYENLLISGTKTGVLAMSVEEASSFFEDNRKIKA